MAGEEFNFIIVDDSELDCFIAEKIILHTGRCKSVVSFTSAAAALEHVKATSGSNEEKFILILDVLMPIMSGFAFVEAFEELPEKVQQKFSIIALTSSMNRNDIDKISSYKSVVSLLDKPITTDAIASFF